MDYSGSFTPANPGTDYPVKMVNLLAQLDLDSDKVDSAGLGYQFGHKRNTTAALNVGYYGGVISVAGTKTIIADGAVALTNAATNYVERTTAGVVSANTAGYTAGKIPMFRAVTAGGIVTSVTDDRQSNVAGDIAIEGILTAKGLVDISGAGAGQIKFPAAQHESADANTFDDYEEGTWTPTLTFGGGSTGLTYSSQSGSYTKIGRMVLFSCYVILTNKGSSTGNAVVEGLPYAISAQHNLTPRCDAISFGGVPTGYAVNGGTNIYFEQTTDAGAISYITHANFANNSAFMLNASYKV